MVRIHAKDLPMVEFIGGRTYGETKNGLQLNPFYELAVRMEHSGFYAYISEGRLNQFTLLRGGGDEMTMNIFVR